MTADRYTEPLAVAPELVVPNEVSRRIAESARRVAAASGDRAVQELLVLARRLATEVAESELLGGRAEGPRGDTE